MLVVLIMLSKQAIENEAPSQVQQIWTEKGRCISIRAIITQLTAQHF